MPSAIERRFRMQDYKVIPQESIKRSRAVIENNMATLD